MNAALCSIVSPTFLSFPSDSCTYMCIIILRKSHTQSHDPKRSLKIAMNPISRPISRSSIFCNPALMRWYHCPIWLLVASSCRTKTIKPCMYVPKVTSSFAARRHTLQYSSYPHKVYPSKSLPNRCADSSFKSLLTTTPQTKETSAHRPLEEPRTSLCRVYVTQRSPAKLTSGLPLWLTAQTLTFGLPIVQLNLPHPYQTTADESGAAANNFITASRAALRTA